MTFASVADSMAWEALSPELRALAARVLSDPDRDSQLAYIKGYARGRKDAAEFGSVQTIVLPSNMSPTSLELYNEARSRADTVGDQWPTKGTNGTK